MARRPLSPTGRLLALGSAAAVGALTLVAMPAAAVPALTDDTASDLEFAFACATMDNMTATFAFHVDALGTTPADRRLVAVHVTADGVDDWEYEYDILPPAGYDFFVTTDYSFDLEIMRSFLDGDALAVDIMRADGTVAASATTTAECFDGSTGATVHDFEVTARAGVPKTIRLLEHVTYPGLDADLVVKSRVTSAGADWSAGWLGVGTADDLALDAATSAALGGAALADDVLTFTPTTVGDYTLSWGVVTAPEYPWTGGSGDESGPATMTVHVIERPAPPADALIVPGSRGPVVAPSSAKPGDDVTVALGAEYAGQYVDLWLHSDPIYLDLVQVGADGTVRVSLPSTAPAGQHRMIVADDIGTLIGWDDISLAAADPGTGTNDVPRGATGLDEGGTTSPWWPAATLAGGLVLGGGLALRKREAQRQA